MIEWLVRSGASYSQRGGKAPPENHGQVRWKHGGNGAELCVSYTGQSGLSFLLEWRDQFRGANDQKEYWKESLVGVERLLDTIARASGHQQTRRRASVDEGIVEIWDKYLHATSSHDLTIEASDGQITAHSGMLQEASPVVRAMLVSPMKEAKSQRIQLTDTSSSAVTLFLETLYTCSSQGDPDCETALSALDLAHRWQVEAVVAILTDLIQGTITEKSFAAIAEQAALKGLETLKQACHKFGSQCAAVQKKIKTGQLPKIVQDLFQDVATTDSQPMKKRKRL
eukprot:Skav214834  [mRNA]  locus=scaffold1772:296808:297656:+ [translate_table: standard]